MSVGDQRGWLPAQGQQLQEGMSQEAEKGQPVQARLGNQRSDLVQWGSGMGHDAWVVRLEPSPGVQVSFSPGNRSCHSSLR